MQWCIQTSLDSFGSRTHYFMGNRSLTEYRMSSKEQTNREIRVIIEQIDFS